MAMQFPASDVLTDAHRGLLRQLQVRRPSRVDFVPATTTDARPLPPHRPSALRRPPARPPVQVRGSMTMLDATALLAEMIEEAPSACGA